MGMKHKNPIFFMPFFDKDGDIVWNTESLGITELSELAPDTLNYKTIFVVCKNSDEKVLEEAIKVKDEWLKKHGLSATFKKR